MTAAGTAGSAPAAHIPKVAGCPGAGGPVGPTSVSFAAELRRRRLEQGLSLAALARVISTSKGYLSRLERGLHHPGEPFARACDQALNAHGDLLKLAVAGQRAAVCPFPGSAAFRPEHAPWFFGRDRALTELLRLLAESGPAGKPVLLTGSSGSGKTSLLRAGLMPAVARGALPSGAFAGTRTTLWLTPESPELAMLRKAPGTDAGFLRPYALIVLDQAERLLSPDAPHARDSDPASVVTALLRTAAQGVPVVVSVRADHADGSRGLMESAALAGRVRLTAMTVEELRQAITAPAQAVGLTVDPGLVEVLLRDIGAVQDFGVHGAGSASLSLLAPVLLAIWLNREDGRALTLDSYRRTGGVGHLAAAVAEQAFATLGPDQHSAVRKVMLHLVRPTGGGAFTGWRGDTSTLRFDPGTAHVVEEFVGRRVLTAGARGVRVTHPGLPRFWQRLAEWLAEDHASFLPRQRLADATRFWHDSGRSPLFLFRGDRLAQARRLAADHLLDERELAFLRHSEALAQHRALDDLHGPDGQAPPPHPPPPASPPLTGDLLPEQRSAAL